MNKRQHEVAKLSLEDEQKILKQLEKNYITAIADVKKKIKILQADDITPSKAYRISFQRQLERQLTSAFDTLQSNNFEHIEDYLNMCYKKGFVGTMYDIQNQGVPFVFSINQKEIIQSIIKTSDGVKLKNKLGTHTKKLKKQVVAEIQRGFSIQASYTDIARNISSYGEADMYRSKLIARTEGHRVQNEAKMTSLRKAKSCGADIVKQWDSTLDGDTRPEHRQLDGQVREIEESFEVNGNTAMCPGGFGSPSQDCNCRCVMVQRVRSMVDGSYQKWNNKSGGFIECKNYYDFEKKYLRASKSLKAQKSLSISLRNYNCNLCKGLGQNYYDEIHDIIDNCNNENVVGIWNKYENQIRVGTSTRYGNQQCFNDKIYINILKNSKGGGFNTIHEVTFHESAHAIDNICQDKAKSKLFIKHFSSLYDNGKFPRTIQDEVKELISETHKRLKKELKVHKNDIEWLYKNYYIGDYEYNACKEKGGLIRNITHKKVNTYRWITMEISKLMPHQKASLSDILQGATNRKIQCGYGHKKGYWKRRTVDGIADGLSAEAFAEMFSATIANPEGLKIIKQYLPKSYRVFEEILKTLLK